jgi:predicted DNA-binding transcriptional regulator YafY
MAKKITVKRKELFEDLWNIGYDRSAEKHDVSLNELLEVYKKYDIPMPDSEYFAAKHKGKPVTIPKLPDSETEDIELHSVWKRKKNNDSALGSKANAICVLQILEDYTDTSRALSAYDIIYYLEENYRMQVDRRTIYNIIDLLNDLGYDINIDKKGSKNYYSLCEKTLEPSEVKIIMDSLALNPLLPAKIGDEICNKVNKYLAKRMPLQRTWYWRSLDKFVENYDTADNYLYFILDEIDAAQSQEKKIEFNYMKYDTNGNKVPYRKEKFVVTPYHLKLENGMYYLFCSGENDNDFIEVRLDMMTNVCVSDEGGNGKQIAGGGKVLGVTYTPESTEYFYTTIKCDNELIDKVATDFQHHIKSVDIKDNGDGKTFNFSLFTNAEFITKWATSVADKCEVLEPQEVREMVINKIKNNKYGV